MLANVALAAAGYWLVVKNESTRVAYNWATTVMVVNAEGQAQYVEGSGRCSGRRLAYSESSEWLRAEKGKWSQVVTTRRDVWRN
jgi:hypothetical protein